jgi:hypothetical protein
LKVDRAFYSRFLTHQRHPEASDVQAVSLEKHPICKRSVPTLRSLDSDWRCSRQDAAACFQDPLDPQNRWPRTALSTGHLKLVCPFQVHFHLPISLCLTAGRGAGQSAGVPSRLPNFLRPFQNLLVLRSSTSTELWKDYNYALQIHADGLLSEEK